MVSVERRGMRRVFAVLLVAVLAIVAILWLVFPWGPIGGLAVDDNRYADHLPGQAGRPIAVTFSTPESLEAVRERKGAGFINAALSVCDDGGRASTEVVTQRAGYFPDEGRVRAIPQAGGGRYGYRAVFDDPRRPASGATAPAQSAALRPLDDLCLSLTGGSMWAGKLWSDHIRLKP